MASLVFLAMTVTLCVLCLPDVTPTFTRKSRAFKSENFRRLPFKRSSPDLEEQDVTLSADGFLPPWLLNRDNGDITVEEIADRLADNRHLALDFVVSFMDTNGDRLISASELLPPFRRPLR